MAVGVVGSVTFPLRFARSSNGSSTISSGSKHPKFLSTSPSIPDGASRHSLLQQLAKSDWKIGRRHSDGALALAYRKKRSNPVDDPFNFGEDEDIEDGELMSTGKQSAEIPKPPATKTSEEGYLDFPEYYNLEISNLGLYIRNDVRRCLCWVAGGVYENMLFFPTIQLLRNRYPGIKIDVVAGDRGKQAYEMNKYINKAIVFDTDADWTVPADLVEFLGVLRGEYYDFIVSTTYAGFKHCATLFMIGGRARRVSYVPKYHSEWVSNYFLTEAFIAPREHLAEMGYDMYEEVMDYVAQPSKGVPREQIPPLQIGVPKRVRSVVQEKMNEIGLSEGQFVVFHGIESDSAASMTSRGDTDSLLPLQFWGQLKKKLQNATGVKAVVVIPHQRERKKVFEACGQDVSMIYITTPGQLASLIRYSTGVVSTNTAAMLMAFALKKPSVALFGSAEKAALFVPPQAENTKVVASRTGKLAGVEVDDAAAAWRSVSEQPVMLAA